MKRIYIISLHIGYWLFFLLLLTFLYFATQINIDSGPSKIHLLKLVGGYIVLPSIISFYGSYLFLFTNFVRKASKVSLLIIVTLVIAVSVISALINVYMLSESFNALIEVGLISICLNGFNMLIGFIIHSFITWFTDLRVKEELTEKSKRLELEMIKLKMDPHFLFNTINNIDVLIESNPEKASEYIVKLSSMLRFYLYKTNKESIKLSDEIKYIREYVELQKIRTSNEDFVKLTIAGRIEGEEIPPMLLIPFIENAFKHARNKKEDIITISIIIENGELIFNCKNKLNLLSINEEKGIGDELIKQRLKLLYNEKFDLKINVTENEYCVALKIEL